jgi:hypothetical protein
MVISSAVPSGIGFIEASIRGARRQARGSSGLDR